MSADDRWIVKALWSNGHAPVAGAEGVAASIGPHARNSAMDATNEALRIQVLAVLDEVIDRLGRPDADYSYSSFASPESGIAEIDGYRDQFRAGVLRPGMMLLLFAPTGPIQEVAIEAGTAAK
jgi:hypothetical protein